MYRWVSRNRILEEGEREGSSGGGEINQDVTSVYVAAPCRH